MNLKQYQRGYYQVGEQKIQNKTVALIEATKKNVFPTWSFNHDIWNSYNWQNPIREDLETLYKERCQQLRDTYDYLILNYSGGSDSFTILNTFLKNNIKLDEIFTYWPIKATKGLYIPNASNRDATNLLSEWDFSLKPDLDYIQKNYPDIKVSIYDYSDHLFKDLTEEEFLVSGHHINIGFFSRQGANLQAGKNIKENKSVAIIMGNDKPQIAIKDNTVYGYFIDLLTTTGMMPHQENNRNVELFYWSADFPKLAIKAKQEVAYAIKSNPNIRSLFKLGASTVADKNLKDKVIRSIIYKNWNPAKFQVGKASSIINCEFDRWIAHNYSRETFYQAWVSYMSGFFDKIDNRYFSFEKDGRKGSYIGFISPFYKICDL